MSDQNREIDKILDSIKELTAIVKENTMDINTIKTIIDTYFKEKMEDMINRTSAAEALGRNNREDIIRLNWQVGFLWASATFIISYIIYSVFKG